MGCFLPWQWKCWQAPVQAQPCYSQSSADHGEVQPLLKGSTAALLVCLTAKIRESGKITLKLSTEQKQFIAGINLPLCQLLLSGGEHSRNKKPGGTKSVAGKGR